MVIALKELHMLVQHALPHADLVAFCTRWRLTEFSFFGSVLRDDFGPDSDIDVIIDFEPGYTPGLAFADLCMELEQLLGRKVDVVTRNGLAHARDSISKRAILSTARVFYERR